MASHLFCFGLGYSAQHLARQLAAENWTVTGTRRQLAEDPTGIRVVAFDGTAPIPLPSGVTHILVSVPPDNIGDPVARVMGDAIAALPRLQWLGYLSTTGVYGDRRGAWVDEDTPPAPTTPRGHMRHRAEQDWLHLFTHRNVPVHIFRLAGIYGPGRNQIESVRQGTARRVIKPGQVFSRIHVEDIVQILRASMTHPNPGRIYNVCDDEAAPPQDVIAFAAEILHMPLPPAISADDPSLSEMAKSFYAENKRVHNTRIKTELGVELLYPTYREGLRALLSRMAKKH
jgi:nucleoside-diphosphate-sugar epimerase